MKEQTRYRVTGAAFLLAIAIMVLPMVFDGKGVRVTQLPELTEPLPPMPTAAEFEALQIPAAEVDAHRAEQALTAGLLDADGFDTGDGTRLGDPTLIEVPGGSQVPEVPNGGERSEDFVQGTTALDSRANRVAETRSDSQSKDLVDASSESGSTAVQTTGSAASSAPARRAPPVASGTARSLAKGPIWAVQLASFASPINATAMRDKLLQDGFEAWTSTARQDSVVRTRVAIGPLLDRDDAQRMRDLVSGRYSVSAIVVHMEP